MWEHSIDLLAMADGFRGGLGGDVTPETVKFKGFKIPNN